MGHDEPSQCRYLFAFGTAGVAEIAGCIGDNGEQGDSDSAWGPALIYWGQKFIETAATGDNIGPWCENLGVAPLHPDAAVPDWMAEDVAFPTSEEQFNQMIVPSLDVMTEYEPAWETQVNEILET